MLLFVWKWRNIQHWGCLCDADMTSMQGIAVTFRWWGFFSQGLLFDVFVSMCCNFVVIKTCTLWQTLYASSVVVIEQIEKHTNTLICELAKEDWNLLGIYFFNGGTSDSTLVPAVKWSCCTPCLWALSSFHDSYSFSLCQSCPMLSCSLPSTVAKYLLHLFLSTVIVTMPWCLFSLMSAVPEAYSGNVPMS